MNNKVGGWVGVHCVCVGGGILCSCVSEYLTRLHVYSYCVLMHQLLCVDACIVVTVSLGTMNTVNCVI